MLWHLLHLKDTPILKQLQLEEALLRSDHRNWCLINEGSPEAIVLGISGNPKQLIYEDRLLQRPVPVIRRFSGGGTVFVDPHTHFVTFIANGDEISISPCPQKIMQWTQNFYSPLFAGNDFQVQENDYTFGNKKFGGNAQYIRKNRWLHHTSFLWNYHPHNMEYLIHPPRMPNYRQNRNHGDFLCRLCDFLPDRDQFSLNVKKALQHNFQIVELELIEVETLLNTPHRKSTEQLSYC